MLCSRVLWQLALQKGAKGMTGNIVGSATALALVAAALLTAAARLTACEEVERVVVDVKAVAKGHSAIKLMGREVVNDSMESIGKIRDLIVSRGDHAVFVVLEVGSFLDLSGHLVALPLESLNLDDPTGRIVVKAATCAALKGLLVFKYGG
jgi:hypothetical protein